MRGFLLSLFAIALARTTSAQHVRREQEIENGQGIVGGSVANAGEFPWFVAFEPMVQCGGTLIAPDRVLTAAHCVVGGAPTSVRVGTSNGEDGEEIPVSCAQYHPDYYVGAGGDLFNDVAVIKLSGSSTATPILLNSDRNYPSTSGTPLTVIGFGATSEGGSVSNVLKKLGTFFQKIASCQGTYPDVEFATHVCGNVDNEGDCQGDSGGPLFDSENLQVGIVSYGIGCARDPSEDIYAGVAKHYDWIQAQLESDECNVETRDPSSCGWILTCLEILCGVARRFSPLNWF